jgi:hypothetical protein
VPFYLATREFFALVRSRLARHGAVVLNVGHPEGSGVLERTLAATMRGVFPAVARDPVTSTNTLLIAGARVTAERLRAGAAALPGVLQPLAGAVAGRLGPAPAGGEVMTDDRAPIEGLIDRSILRYAERAR